MKTLLGIFAVLGVLHVGVVSKANPAAMQPTEGSFFEEPELHFLQGDLDPLGQAILAGQVEEVQQLIETEVAMGHKDINKALEGKITYLMLALYSTQNYSLLEEEGKRGETRVDQAIRMIRMLLKAGADTMKKIANGRTILHFAIQMNKGGHLFFAVDQLMQWHKRQGHSFDIQDNDGRTPLHYAATSMDVRVVDRLAHFGANMNIQDKTGATALHFAAGYGTSAMTQALACYGANKTIRNKDEKTALDWANERKNDKEKARVIEALTNTMCPVSY